MTLASLFDRADELLTPANENSMARWAGRCLLLGLVIFALAVPHSIAAAQIGLSLGVAAWLVRDLAARRLHFTRTPFDWPLLGFCALTVVSACASVEPAVSLPKLRSLTLFALIYLGATNLRPRAARLLVMMLVCSGLLGVGFSLGEKLIGRGMVVTAVNPDSPLVASELQAGDVIWMVARHRVSSVEEAARVIRGHRAGERLELEALHNGDPLPVKLTVTEAMRAQANPLGVSVGGRSRRFRVSGFSRHFITYAEQMQIFGLLALGLLLAAPRRRLAVPACLLTLFGLTLLLTASRSVIASFLLAALVVAAVAGGRRLSLAVIFVVLLLGGAATLVIFATRDRTVVRFADDSSGRRLSYMRAGLRLIPKHPLFGVGMDAHQRHWKEWGFPGDYVTHTHSTPIQIALERGLPALACLVWLVIGMCRQCWRSYRRAGSELAGTWLAWLALGTFGALLGFSISSLVNYNFGDSEVLMLLLFLIGLVLAIDQEVQLQPASRNDAGAINAIGR